MIQEIFTSTAPHYDIMNDLLSLGLHHLWKAHFVSNLPWTLLPKSFTYMDMACGSGDVGFQVLLVGEAQHHTVQTFLCDANLNMLDLSRKKWNALYTTKNQSLPAWVCTTAESTPFPSAFFHLYTVAFGLRNMHNRLHVLQEAWRILKPGGICACLEFSQPTHSGWAVLGKIYIHHIVPWLGEKVANNRKAYTYLANSIDQFPSASVLSQEFEAAGFQDIRQTSLFGGFVAMHTGIK